MVINTKTDKTICQGYQKNESYFLLLLAFFITFSLLQFQPCSVTRVVTRKSHVEKTTIYQIKKYFVFTSRDTRIFETMSSASHFSTNSEIDKQLRKEENDEKFACNARNFL